jgi:membrane protease YdiL (CAAX protease family)
LVGVAFWIASQVVALLVVTPLMIARAGLDAGAAMSLLATDPLISAGYFLIYAALSLVAFRWLLRRFAPDAYEATFDRRGVAKEIAWGLLLGAGLITLGVLALIAAGVYRGSGFGLSPEIVAGLAMSAGAACGEETLFRGVFFRLLDARFGSAVALVTISLVFGLIHLGNPGADLWGGLAIGLAAGPLLGGAYLLTGRLWLPIGIHFAWNAAQSAVFGITVSGTETGRGLWQGELTGPEWLTGGSLGIEGSVPLILFGALAGVAFIVLCVKRGRWRAFRDARAEGV